MRCRMPFSLYLRRERRSFQKQLSLFYTPSVEVQSLRVEEQVSLPLTEVESGP